MSRRSLPSRARRLPHNHVNAAGNPPTPRSGPCSLPIAKWEGPTDSTIPHLPLVVRNSEKQQIFKVPHEPPPQINESQTHLQAATRVTPNESSDHGPQWEVNNVQTV